MTKVYLCQKCKNNLKLETCPILINYPQILSRFQKGARWLKQELEFWRPCFQKNQKPHKDTNAPIQSKNESLFCSFLLV